MSTGPIDRLRGYPADSIELVIEGTDDQGHRCWRTYTGMVSPSGTLALRSFTAYSPPTDWDELSLPGELRDDEPEDESATTRAEQS